MGASGSKPNHRPGEVGFLAPGPIDALDDVTILTPAGWVSGSVVIDGAVIGSVIGSVVPGFASGAPSGEVIVVPGLIDLQVNGGWGIDLAQSPERLWELGAHMLSVGVTSWLPTLVTSEAPAYQKALDALAVGPRAAAASGATPLGWHFEGPWISNDRAGAHRSEHIQPIPASVPNGFASSNGLRLVTLAPELRGADSLIRQLVAGGVTVSLGHSNATAIESRAGLAAGATMGTHLFNAMTGLHHRSPGLAAALLTGDAYVGLIADGLHVDDEMIRLAWSLAEKRLVLVSDSMAGLGLDRDNTKLGSERVVLDGSSARLRDGTLAGSVISLRDAVRHLHSVTGCSLAQACRAASAVPAAAIGETERGSIVAGMAADLTVFDRGLNVLATIVAGEVVFAGPWLGQAGATG